MLLASRRLTFLPLVTATVLKSFPALFNVTSLPEPAVRLATPVTARAPLCVIAPPVVTFNDPEMVEAARFKELASVRVILFPLTIPTELKYWWCYSG